MTPHTGIQSSLRRLIACLGLVGLLGCGPVLLLPGGELDGTLSAAPDDWTFTESISTVQLETRPDSPYSVNIWATGLDEFLYIHAGANRARWVEYIEVDPRVRIRIDDKIHPLVARRVTDPAEFRRFADAYEDKYGSRPRNEDVGVVYLYRLEQRP